MLEKSYFAMRKISLRSYSERFNMVFAHYHVL